ncbi:MAG: DNA polymerase II [Candidatus Pelagadaptatus aseana]|uniref:DNA polymerase II n=1 Tax=Candidatus Pelagadaptatus aseana TaxID=3120508 RepID=UPI0039B2D030
MSRASEQQKVSKQQKVPEQQIDGFLLTRQWDDATGSNLFRLKQLTLDYWLTSAQGPVRVRVDDQPAVFFLAAEDEDKAHNTLLRVLGVSASHPSVLPAWEIKPLNLRDFRNRRVVGIYFREQRVLYRAREALKKSGMEPLEADVHPSDRFLMERFVTAGVSLKGEIRQRDGYREMINPRWQPAPVNPAFTVVSLDIETDLAGDYLYCIGVTLHRTALADAADADPMRRVFMVADPQSDRDDGDARPDYLHYCPDEKNLLETFVQWFTEQDPDIVIGWNVINFDLRFLQKKAEQWRVRLSLGRNARLLDWRQSRSDDEHYTLVIPGRPVLDGIDTLKSATYQFESFSLDYVAGEVLQRGKLVDDVDNRAEKITEQFHSDKVALARYNLEDCQLVWDIFQSLGLFEFAIERANLTGLTFDRFGGSVAAFDNRYLPRLHRSGFVGPALVDNPVGVGSPGGYVMDSIPGVYQHVLVLDFKSLYPSIMRTFHIDPLARVTGQFHEQAFGHKREAQWDRQETEEVDRELLVPGFNGAVFLKQTALLPDIIGELWMARDQAKRQQNAALSQAIKIIMNSFYGVLGTPGCRFFDYRLPSSITLRGHQILTRSRELIEEQGHRVIYGDTDSVFVHLATLPQNASLQEVDQLGHQLADSLNRYWQSYLQDHYHLESRLEIEYETHYSRFVMPTIRGSDTGSKKRYAGLVEKAGREPEMVFKGLEAVRTDWTPMARQFQRDLYGKVFAGEAVEAFIRETVEAIKAGEHDRDLWYRKRIRRRLDDYKKNVPPHVQAARKADEWLESQGMPARYQRGGWVQYALTTHGPEPMEHRVSPFDYEEFIERQIAPIVDGILHFEGKSFESIVDQQLGLF